MLYYDREGNPITRNRWAQLIETGYTRVALHEEDSVLVSTVWTGIDMGYGDESDTPLIFETMILNGRNEGHLERYATLDEANEGHARAVTMAQHTKGVKFSDRILGRWKIHHRGNRKRR